MSLPSLSKKLIPFSLLSLFILTACEDANKQKVAPPKPHVIVTTISETEIKPHIDFIGRTEATEDVSLRSQVEGTLLKRHFTGGDDVQKGDLLFEIDPAPYQTQVSQDKAALTHAESAYSIAKNRWQRGKKLRKTGAMSEIDFDELTAQVNQTKADVALKKAALERSELNLSYTKIVAPISGRISRSQVSLGDLITANNVELGTLVQLDPIWVNFQISEKQINQARQDNSSVNEDIDQDSLKVDIYLNKESKYKHSGKIDFVDNRVDQSTGTLAIRAVFPNPDKLLLPGQYTNLTITLPNSTKAILIPQAAVQEEQQGRFVLVVNDKNIVEKRMVKLGARYDVRWMVEEGLNAGDKIIVDGLQKVRMGIEVETTEQTDKPFTAANNNK